MTNKITFISRKMAEEMKPLPNSAIISFYDVSEPPANLSEDWTAICRIRCHDKDTPTLGLEIFSTEMAEIIQNFCEKNFESCEHFYVHCQLGQSRSGGAALAISEFYGVPCFKVNLPVTSFSYPIYNKLVYRKTLLALHQEQDYF